MRHLLKTVQRLSIALIIFWILDVLILSYNIHKTNQKLEDSLANIKSPTDKFTAQTMAQINQKMDSLKNTKGIYSARDAIPLFSSFLNVVPTVGIDSIVQIEYNNNKLEIFLNNKFNNSQFSSYQNILSTQHINANIQDYKSYVDNKKDNQNNNNPLENDQQSIDATWVIKLEPEIMITNKELF